MDLELLPYTSSPKIKVKRYSVRFCILLGNFKLLPALTGIRIFRLKWRVFRTFTVKLHEILHFPHYAATASIVDARIVNCITA